MFWDACVAQTGLWRPVKKDQSANWKQWEDKEDGGKKTRRNVCRVEVWRRRCAQRLAKMWSRSAGQELLEWVAALPRKRKKHLICCQQLKGLRMFATTTHLLHVCVPVGASSSSPHALGRLSCPRLADCRRNYSPSALLKHALSQWNVWKWIYVEKQNSK